MDLKENWDTIRNHFSRSFGSSLHVAIASVDAENNPTVTPIGTVFLNRNQTGFYFEKFTSSLPGNGTKNPNVCLLAVNSSKVFWIKSLFKGRFPTHPAIKLYGQLGEKREATQAELRALKKRLKLTRRLKGHQYLWGEMTYVREISFSKAEKMKLGKMTSAL